MLLPYLHDPRFNSVEPGIMERVGCSMVRIADMDSKLMFFMRDYPWRRLDEIAPAHRTRDLADCRVALVSSAGLVAPGQAPYDAEVKGGDRKRLAGIAKWMDQVLDL